MTNYTQADIDSLSIKLNELSDAEKAALAHLVAEGDVEVQGFAFDPAPQPEFKNVQWVFSPAPSSRFENVPNSNTITVQICHQ